MAHILLNQRMPSPGARQEQAADQGGGVVFCLVGDFSGRQGRGDFSLHELEADATVEDAMSAVGPEIRCEQGAFPLREIEDLHPDSLLRQSRIVRRLDELSARLSSPGTATGVLAEFGFGEPSPDHPEGGSGGDLLSRMLGGTAAPGTGQARAFSTPAVDAFLREAVKGAVVPDQPAVVRTVQQHIDSLRTEALDALLHDPAVAAAERAWFSLDLLFSGIEGSDDCPVRFCLLDASQEALLADARRGGALLLQALAPLQGDLPGGERLGALVFFDAFDLREAEILHSFRACAAALGATAFCGLEPPLFAPAANPGLPEAAAALAERFADLSAARGRSDAARLVAVPFRFLLRSPYGSEADPVADADYEEVRRPEDVERLPWASGAVPAALAYGTEWSRREEPPELPCAVDLGALPFCTLPTADGQRMVPNGGFWIGNDAGDALLRDGLTVLLSRRDQPAVRVLLAALDA